ncbi:hypothetical protein L2E82_17216 [Cichorium intybus]|uniref:Uncharacterized protein n=1 Tax=Cichorium intybus TaxID=13427 RepID=A0ACB9F7N5_CICIN|nr:hypothetical protein L2E82_17216 [Cichorium intybus]
MNITNNGCRHHDWGGRPAIPTTSETERVAMMIGLLIGKGKATVRGRKERRRWVLVLFTTEKGRLHALYKDNEHAQ